MPDARSVALPPYVAYRTFTNFLAELRARGVPSRIDRSVMPHKSGAVQSQLLLTLTYLGLVAETGKPTERLRRILGSEGAKRKELMQEMVRSCYDFIFGSQFDLKAATSQQVEELFQSTGASGETVRRAISFFLSAARESGIPCSSYIKPHRRKKSSLKNRETVEGTSRTDVPAPESPRSEDGFKTVPLKSGGCLRIELSTNLFDLDEADREFIFTLIDHLKSYPQE